MLYTYIYKIQYMLLLMTFLSVLCITFSKFCQRHSYFLLKWTSLHGEEDKRMMLVNNINYIYVPLSFIPGLFSTAFASLNSPAIFPADFILSNYILLYRNSKTLYKLYNYSSKSFKFQHCKVYMVNVVVFLTALVVNITTSSLFLYNAHWEIEDMNTSTARDCSIWIGPERLTWLKVCWLMILISIHYQIKKK